MDKDFERGLYVCTNRICEEPQWPESLRLDVLPQVPSLHKGSWKGPVAGQTRPPCDGIRVLDGCLLSCLASLLAPAPSGRTSHQEDGGRQENGERGKKGKTGY